MTLERFQEHSANERTYLAWNRTSIAIAGFGILIERLPSGDGPSWAGAALVILSALLIGVSTLRFLAIRRHLTRGGSADAALDRMETMFAGMLMLLLVTAGVFLITLIV